MHQGVEALFPQQRNAIQTDVGVATRPGVAKTMGPVVTSTSAKAGGQEEKMDLMQNQEFKNARFGLDYPSRLLGQPATINGFHWSYFSSVATAQPAPEAISQFQSPDGK